MSWRHSSIMQDVEALLRSTLIYSNGDDAIYYLANRPAQRLPDTLVLHGLYDTGRHYVARMEQMGKRLLEEDAAIAYFYRYTDRDFLPTERELLRKWNLHTIVRRSDGAIYRRSP